MHTEVPNSSFWRTSSLQHPEADFLLCSADTSSLLAVLNVTGGQRVAQISSVSPFVYLQTSHSLLPTFFLLSVFSNFHLLLPACVIVASPHNFGRRFPSFSLLISRLIFGLTHPNPSPLPLPPPLFSSVSDFLQSFSSSFRAACSVQCSEVMAEYNGPPSRKKREQFVPVAASGDSRDQGCDLHGPVRARTHTQTHTKPR